jgi:small-conductance mechanosensitive channel
MADTASTLEQLPLKAVTEFFSLGHMVGAALTLAIAWLLLKLFTFFTQLLARRFSRYRMQIVGMLPVIRILVWVGAVYVIVIDIFAPPESSLLALLASTGLAVGLAAQDVIRNLISGVLVLFEKPFRVGDMVKVGNEYGEVRSIGLRSVQIHTFDDSIVTVPNSVVTDAAVSNSNSGALDELVVIPFTVPASLDVEQVKTLAWEAAACSPYVYLKKPILVITEDLFNRSFLTRFTIKAYVLDVRLERVFASDVLERVKKELRDQKLLTDEVILGALRTDVTVTPDIAQ